MATFAVPDRGQRRSRLQIRLPRGNPVAHLKHAVTLFCFGILLGCSSGGSDGNEIEESAPAVSPAVEALVQDSTQARVTLAEYLSHLAEGRYEEAAELYGGNWREAGSQFVEAEDVDTLSTAGFLVRTCAGIFRCDLRLQEVRAVEVADPTRVLLRVTLQDRSGARFQMGPCCGEEGEPVTEFDFIVRKRSGEFVVDELPIYIP